MKLLAAVAGDGGTEHGFGKLFPQRADAPVREHDPEAVLEETPERRILKAAANPRGMQGYAIGR